MRYAAIGGILLILAAPVAAEEEFRTVETAIPAKGSPTAVAERIPG